LLSLFCKKELLWTLHMTENLLLGDEHAFEWLYRKYHPLLVVFALKYVDNYEDGQDIANEVFIKLHKHRERFEDEAHIRAFLYVSVRNLSLNYLKMKKRHGARGLEYLELLPDDTLLKYDYMIRAEIVEKVHEAIDNLPDECKRIFKMLIYDELKPAEIAMALNITVNNIYVQKNRALSILRIKIGQYLLLLVLILRILGLL